MILQRAGYDFRGAGRAAIDQNDQALSLRDVSGMGIEPFGVIRRAPAHRENFAALEEIARDRDSLIQNAAAIVAQIDDIALDPGADLFLQRRYRGLQTAIGMIVESRDMDIADIAFAPRRDRLDRNETAHDLHVERLLDAIARDKETDLGAAGAAHLLLHIVELEAGNGRAVDLKDRIAGLHARARSRRTVHDGNGLDRAFIGFDHDADAAILTFSPDLHVRKRLGIEIARMRVKIGEHAADGILDKQAVIRLIDISGADLCEGGAETVELIVIARRFRCAVGEMKQRGRGTKAEGAAGKRERNALFHHWSLPNRTPHSLFM